MEIICDNCQSKLKIPEGKIPAGKTASFSCPKCQHKLTVSSPAEAREQSSPAETEPSPFPSFDFEEDTEEAYDASDKPFDFIEEEGKTALVCESDSGVKGKITKVLDLMEYHITEVEDTRDALKKMRYHDYNIIIINENFDSSNPDSNGIMIYLERLNMVTRRNMIVA